MPQTEPERRSGVRAVTSPPGTLMQHGARAINLGSVNCAFESNDQRSGGGFLSPLKFGALGQRPCWPALVTALIHDT